MMALLLLQAGPQCFSLEKIGHSYEDLAETVSSVPDMLRQGLLDKKIRDFEIPIEKWSKMHADVLEDAFQEAKKEAMRT